MRSLSAFLLFFLLAAKGPVPEAPNDSALMGKGDHLVPAKETRIDLRRDVLNMQLQGEAMHVDVHFAFFDPGDSDTLTDPGSPGDRVLRRGG
jgi:hypothetical protein